MIEAVGDGKAQAKGHQHTSNPYARGYAPVGGKHANVHLESDDEEVEQEAKVRHIVKHGHGILGEYLLLEIGDPCEDRRTQEDTANDLGNDPGLSDKGERVVQ